MRQYWKNGKQDLDILAAGGWDCALWVVVLRRMKLRKASVIQVCWKKAGSCFNQGRSCKAKVDMLEVTVSGWSRGSWITLELRLGGVVMAEYMLGTYCRKRRDGPSSHHILASWADSYPKSQFLSKWKSWTGGLLRFYKGHWKGRSSKGLLTFFVNTQNLSVHNHFVEIVRLRAFTDRVLFERKTQYDKS